MFDRLKRGISGFVERISKTELKGEELDPILWDFKLMLLENDVALDVADQICGDVKKGLLEVDVGRFEDRKRIVARALCGALTSILATKERVSIIETAEVKRQSREPLVVVFVGVNGSGKTTSIAKVAWDLLQNGYSVVLAGSDTFRAGSIEQLEEHGRRLGVRVIKHHYGADSAAVAFDAINYARAHGINAVLIDTAGRMQTKRNLMEEMQKIVRVAKPDLTIFVGDALTGNDAWNQAEEFNRFVPIDGSILTKVDADAKGGAAVSITYITKRPIVHLGTGQGYEDLVPFDPNYIVRKILG